MLECKNIWFNTYFGNICPIIIGSADCDNDSRYVVRQIIICNGCDKCELHFCILCVVKYCNGIVTQIAAIHNPPVVNEFQLTCFVNNEGIKLSYKNATLT